MKLLKTKIKDLLIIKTNIYKDNRGFFKEIENLNDNATYYCRGFAENIAGTSLASNIFQFTTKNFYNINI